MKYHIHNILSRLTKKPIYTIIFVGILIRLIIIALYQHVTVYPDSADYIELAKRLLNFNLNGYEGQRSPGYPLLLSLANTNLYLTAIFQSISGIITCIFIYKICIALNLAKRSSLLLAILSACYVPSIFFEYSILSESLTLLFITISFYILFRLLKENNPPIRYYLLLSFSCAFLVLIKPFYIYMAGLLFIFLIIHHITTKAVILKVLSVIILPSLIFVSWSAVNKVNTGYFTSTTYFGFNMAQNCVSFAENTTDEYRDIGNIYAKYRDNRDSSEYEIAMAIWEAYPELKDETGLSLPDLSNKLYKYSITTIKMNVTAYIKQAVISWADFWKTSLYWEYDSFEIPHANVILKYICYAERIILQLIKIMFVLLIPYHLIMFIRKKNLSPQLIISVVVLSASILQALVTYGTNSRFSFPFEMLIVISVALDYLNAKRIIKQKS